MWLWNDPCMIIRKETSSDWEAIRAVHVAAFTAADGADPVEGRLVDALRACDGWIPELSLVAEVDGVVRGHVVTTRGYVGAFPALGLAPIGVDPGSQGVGIGSALMHATIGAAEALHEPLIALLGDPGYYARFGFIPSSDLTIDPPDPQWGIHFQVLALSAYTTQLRGTFRYAAPFDDL
jgi:putative acetyltransferase